MSRIITDFRHLCNGYHQFYAPVIVNGSRLVAPMTAAAGTVGKFVAASGARATRTK
jgi:hypothetical protein